MLKKGSLCRLFNLYHLGGVAIVGGDLKEADQLELKKIVKLFGDKVQGYANTMSALAPHIKVLECNHLFVAKDSMHFHLVFTNNFGGTNVNYRDLTEMGRVELKSIVTQLRSEGDDVIWAFSCPANIALAENEPYIQEGVVEYVGNILKAEETASLETHQTHYTPVISTPEISTGIKAFQKACPAGAKTVFIMQSGNSKLHVDIVTAIKNALDRHDFIGLRADDRKFMDDPFSNTKTYMHSCDFGIAIFDHMAEEELDPKVALELGYMMGLGKDVLLLRDKILAQSTTDLTGTQYKFFDADNLVASIPSQIEEWLKGFDLL